MTLSQWLDANRYKVLSFDGHPENAGQCVQAVCFYARDVLGLPVIYGNAADWWYSNKYDDRYVRIAYKPGAVIPPGAIVVWDRDLPNSGGYGHVAVMLGSAESGKFISIDSNWNGKYLHYVTHDYRYVKGYLIPRVAAVVPKPKGEPMIADTDNEYARWQKLGWHVRGRNLTRQEFKNSAVGRSWLQAIEILEDSDEADRTQVAQEIGIVAKRDNWEGQIYAGQALAKALDGQVKELKVIADNLKADDDRDKQLINTQVMKIAALTAELQNQGTAKVTVAKPAHNWFVTMLAKMAAGTSKKA